MKLSLNWLKDYVDPKISVDDLVHRLTMAGLEVESVHSVGKDTVLDLEITPNRPDCLNTIGLAREISAICAKNLKLPTVKSYKSGKTTALSVAIEDKKDCTRYIGTRIENVNVMDAPAWMTERLQALGIRSIGNAVDVTNFVLMEMGQPLHVFDADKIVGNKILVRRARAGEKIVTLDGVERKLDPSILVIADAQKPIAIAGIMGGMDTQVTAQTRNIVLESAQFEMGIVRRGSRLLGLKSDASYRFERGVDLKGVLDGANRATALLVELTRGKFTARVDQGQQHKDQGHVIGVSVLDIENLLGTRVSATQVKNALTRLGLKVVVDKKKGFKITTPSFRNDLKQPVDIIEEVARIIGYDHLNVSFPHIQVANIAPDTRPRKIKKIVADALVAQGFSETITFSLINQKDLEKSGQSDLTTMPLLNALSAEHNILRPSLLPSLLKVAAMNFNHGQKNLKLFEIGKRYFVDGEKSTLAILATGRRGHDWRNNSKDVVDFFDVKGVMDQVYSKLGVPEMFDAKNIVKISKTVLQQWDIKAGDVYFVEIDLHPIFAKEKPVVKFEALMGFPAIHRDISVAVKRDVAYGAMEQTAYKLGADILKRVDLIEEYVGDKIEKGQRGLVFSLVYQHKERTLREEEVQQVHQRIVEAFARDFAAVQR